MAAEPRFKDSEEREISRGGRATAAWILGLTLLLVGGGFGVATWLAHRLPPPARPGTTSATTTAGEVLPPSPQ